MRILRVLPAGPYSHSYWPEEPLGSFQDTIEAFRRKGLLYPNGFIPSMKKLGHECFETIFDHRPLQELWCRENNRLIHESQWELKVLEAQIEAFKPEILYLERSAFFSLPLSFRKHLRDTYSCLRAITGFIGTQMHGTKHISSFSDIESIFVGDESLQNTFREVRIKAFVVPHAFDYDPALFSSTHPKHNMVFLGSSGFGYIDHQQRYKDLVQLHEAGLLESWISENIPPAKEKVRQFLLLQAAKLPQILLKTLEQIAPSKKIGRLVSDALEPKNIPWYFSQKPLRSRFPRSTFPPLFGLDYLEKLAQAKIVFNSHVDLASHAGNMRCFETTGIGSCLLTDRASQLKHLFVEGKEIVGYNSIPEAIEKAKYLLEHEAVRQSIARQGQERTLREHTTWHRCLQIDKLLRESL